MRVLEAVEEVNEYQKTILYQKLCRRLGVEANLKNKTIALWGLAFKPETDDMREATALVTIDLLLKAGCKVVVFDPVAMDECHRRVGDKVLYASDMYDALNTADAMLLLTEWKQFRLPDWTRVLNLMRTPLIIDGRNIYNSNELAAMGIQYECIGMEKSEHAVTHDMINNLS